MVCGLPACKNAHADGRIRIKQTDGEKFVFAVIDDGEFAGLAGAVLLVDAVGKQPRMAAAQDGLGRRGDRAGANGCRSLCCGGFYSFQPARLGARVSKLFAPACGLSRRHRLIRR